MNIGFVVLGFLTIIIGVVLHSTLGTTVIDNTSTDTCASINVTGSACLLENASTAAKALYGIEELVYAMLGIIFVVGGGVAILKGMGINILGGK